MVCFPIFVWMYWFFGTKDFILIYLNWSDQDITDLQTRLASLQVEQVIDCGFDGINWNNVVNLSADIRRDLSLNLLRI